MARPRKFDEFHVVGPAMELFWRQGYAACSTRHLEEATGLGPSSSRNSFGSKADLFARALDRY